MIDAVKPVFWMGTSRKDLKSCPRSIQRDIGHALYAAQCGEVDPSAKPLKGFRGITVQEIVTCHDTNTYRSVYTVRFQGAVYVLHAFQKKSKKGIATPQYEIDLIEQRLREAQQYHRNRQN